MSKEKLVGIGGGVGPEAGRLFHGLIIINTQASTDQGHLGVIHISLSDLIPDRTKFLLGEDVGDLAEGMAVVMQAIKAAADVINREVVAGVPCNTFHAPKIWDRFVALLDQHGVEIQVLHMLNETANFINENFPEVKKIGLMSTIGTRDKKVFQQILEPKGYTIIEVPEEKQGELHDTIYNPDWGIKGAEPDMERARYNFLHYIRLLKEQGAEVVILGCTEIPLALPGKEEEGVPLIDPMVALARALVRNANPAKLKPL